MLMILQFRFAPSYLPVIAVDINRKKKKRFLAFFVSAIRDPYSGGLKLLLSNINILCNSTCLLIAGLPSNSVNAAIG